MKTQFIEIEDYENYFMNMEERQIAIALKYAIEKIEFLEEIYQKRSFDFSDDFTHQAFKERQQICQMTSACFDILRNKYKKDYHANNKYFDIIN